MEENTIVEQEKKNKKIALVLAIILCSLCFIFGIVGGITSFIRFVSGTDKELEENMKTPQQQEYSDGVFNILNGNTVVGTYKCQNKSCGYAYGIIDDGMYDLKTEELNDYQINKVINDRFVLLYDDDEDEGSLHRTNGVKVYDFTTGSVVKELKGVKNYNNNNMLVFIVRDINDKWGIIKFDDDKVVDVVNAEYDYIGAFIPTGEKLNEQSFYVAKKNDDWIILDINNGKEYSIEFSLPIVAYDGEMVVVKNDNVFYVYDVRGNLLFKDATDFNFIGGGLLVVNSSNNVVVFDAYAITSLYSHEFVQINSIVPMETDDGYVIKVNDEDVYSKQGKQKSPRKTTGASIDMIVTE